ncbi:MetS family NSS transporter small subunit [candidate division KSB1 bacterium]|nr:MetS family NSS transporter small subunit [candidate division KSB1 bacterium]
MELTALINMIVIITFLWGGFFYFLLKAIKRETEKTKES